MNTQTQVAPIALTISNISIRQDANGRYCLNDLHKASRAEKKAGPSYWLAIQQTQELINELKTDTDISVSVVKGGAKQQGTYAVKELVYAYAMWISAQFHIAVIRAYDALQQKPRSDDDTNMLVVMTRAEFEEVLDERLQQIASQTNAATHQADNPLSYQLRAPFPQYVRVVVDWPVEDLNKQIRPQGFQVVRV